MDFNLSKFKKTLLCIQCEQSIGDAWQLMKRYSVRHLPVVDGDVLLGIVSDRDFLRYRSDLVNFDDLAPTPELSRTPITNIMSWPVQVLDASQSLERAARLMIEERISAFLVAEGEQVVGIVTSEDLLGALVDLLSQERAQRDSKAPVENTWTLGDYVKSSGFVARFAQSPLGKLVEGLSNSGI